MLELQYDLRRGTHHALTSAAFGSEPLGYVVTDGIDIDGSLVLDNTLAAGALLIAFGCNENWVGRTDYPRCAGSSTSRPTAGCLFCYRQGEGEGAALAFSFACDPDPSTLRIDESARDRQTDAASATRLT